MRRIPIPPTPASLNEDTAQREREDIAKFYAVAANRTSAYTGTLRAYSADDVKKALRAAFHGKCAYCESPVEGTGPPDTEHFRPKAGVTIAGRFVRPGYHWLASHWENLLPSCIDCNRPREQEFPAGMPAVAGKHNQFPLISEAKRAKAQGEEKFERPLLLHPYVDDPAEHLEFIWEPNTPQRGQVVPRKKGTRKSRIGKTSIDVYALQRQGLINQRRERIERLLAHLEQLKEIREEVEKTGFTTLLATLFARARDEVAIFLEPDKPYSAMCRQVVQEFYPDLIR